MTLEKQSITLRDWLPYIIHAGPSCLNTNCIMLRLGEMRDCCVLTFFFYIVFLITTHQLMRKNLWKKTTVHCDATVYYHKFFCTTPNCTLKTWNISVYRSFKARLCYVSFVPFICVAFGLVWFVLFCLRKYVM